MVLSLDYSRVVAALEDRIQFLIKKFPSVPEESIRFLSKCDPAGGKYLEYLVSQRAKGILVNRDDDSTCWFVEHALEFFIMVNQSKKVKEHIQEIFPAINIPPEISRINIKDIYGLAVRYYDDVKNAIRRFLRTGKKHSKVVYQDDTYKIIVFTWDPSMNWDDVLSEICAYGKGKWCTQHKESAEEYLQSAGGLYIVFKDGKSLLQTDRKEFKDVNNNNFNFSEYPDLAIILMKTGIIQLDKKTLRNPDPNKYLLEKLHYYMDFISDPVRQYLRENDFV
jgi:hypothetical protein